MAQYRTCPYCGASLDPGEKCDCQDKEKECGLPLREASQIEKEDKL